MVNETNTEAADQPLENSGQSHAEQASAEPAQPEQALPEQQQTSTDTASSPLPDNVIPLAIVKGQAYTNLPQDLYIPPDALEVFLETFEGPLDLLLYLIKRQNLDVLDIPIAEITRQ